MSVPKCYVQLGPGQESWPRPGCRDILRDICLKKTNSNVVSCRDICLKIKTLMATCRDMSHPLRTNSHHLTSHHHRMSPAFPPNPSPLSDLTILARGFQGTPHIEPLSTQMPEQFVPPFRCVSGICDCGSAGGVNEIRSKLVMSCRVVTFA